MKKKVRNILFFIIVILGISMVLCKSLNKSNVVKENGEEESQESYMVNDREIIGNNNENLSAWITYWDLNVDDDIKALDKRLKEISYFVADFNSDNSLIIREELINYYNKTKNDDYIKYLTVVNDKKNIDMSYSLKDINLLKILLKDSSSRSNHVKEIINLAKKNNFDGVEIDYEAIKNDMELWNNYLLFINELYSKCTEVQLKLRVVLEPNTPIEELSFSEGPTYVMMCYNLHDSSSDPGEKANPKFIKELINKMEKVPGKKVFAISTGGFDWASNKKTTSICQSEAEILAKKYNVKEERDLESQCLVFKYVDESNISHEVWYADKNTLITWMNVIDESGYDISIWKLSGNSF